MPPSQRVLFEQFYKKAVALGAKKGKKLGKDIYNLLCQQTLMICSYQEVMHKEYGHSAFFGIYIRVPYNGKDYIIPGSLLVSLHYFLDKRPLLIF
ncbi:uncharacterized protein [Blastocystis hominis]|uniref:Uncharacterized protein n=1 Tax=Blastocystis hominis TaxID=12968 RepID=D8M0A8_BLAHO|nr:uncharacterized protein [Blastocystis hominis]CBK21497.2 unnamed protein product [Blastocystis hominis]|eukprot:XP_012895545.1 uncharacterized protein [Blastocystis hominis]